MTGLSTKTRRAIADRDRGICQRCRQQRSTDAHHRINRGSGGSNRPEVNECLAALVSVCRWCHIWITEHPTEAEDTGWVVWRWDSIPPSLTALEDLHGQLFYLTDAGQVVYGQPIRDPFLNEEPA